MIDRIADYLCEQATRCRNLASATLDFRVSEALRGMAAEYDNKADQLKGSMREDHPEDQVGG